MRKVFVLQLAFQEQLTYRVFAVSKHIDPNVIRRRRTLQDALVVDQAAVPDVHVEREGVHAPEAVLPSMAKDVI